MLGNLGSPLMLEGIFSALLAVVAIVDFIMCRKGIKNLRSVRIVGAVIGVVCLVAMTYAYATSYGNAAWCAAPTYALFVVSGLASGSALWFVIGRPTGEIPAKCVAILNTVFACVLIWQAFVFSSFEANGAVCLAIGAVLAAASAVTAFSQPKMKAKPETVIFVVALLSIAALVVSRYGFYMASII